jgi:divalent metal cation (Fe/Co/Zn/Cd) transporter
LSVVQVPASARVFTSVGRSRLEERARRLASGGNAWHVIEFAVAVGAGIAASSVALIAFGADSLIELLSGTVVVWLFTAGRGASATAERTAQRLVAASYFLLTAYIVAGSVNDLVGGHRPSVSWLGVGLAAVTAPTMPLLARAKRRVGRQLRSTATVAEAQQNQLCAYLSIALLVGLLANAIAGWWWADALAALAIAVIAGYEGLEAWRGEGCGCC